MFILMNFINFFCFIHEIKIYLEEVELGECITY